MQKKCWKCDKNTKAETIHKNVKTIVQFTAILNKINVSIFKIMRNL